MRVVALKAWSNGSMSMEEKSVYEIDDALATDLIAQGLVAEAATYFGGGGDDAVYVTFKESDGTADKTWNDLPKTLNDNRKVYFRVLDTENRYTPWIQATQIKSGMPATINAYDASYLHTWRVAGSPLTAHEKEFYMIINKTGSPSVVFDVTKYKWSVEFDA